MRLTDEQIKCRRRQNNCRYMELKEPEVIARERDFLDTIDEMESEKQSAIAPFLSRATLWEFDRYVNGRKMAEGARVHAASQDEALTKARELFKDAPESTFAFNRTWGIEELHRALLTIDELQKKACEKQSAIDAAVEQEHIRCLKVFEHEIAAATGPTGGWLVSPKKLFSQIALYLLHALESHSGALAARDAERERAIQLAEWQFLLNHTNKENWARYESICKTTATLRDPQPATGEAAQEGERK